MKYIITPKVGMKLVCIQDDNIISLGCMVGDIVVIESIVTQDQEYIDLGYVFVRTPNSPDIPRAIFLSENHYIPIREVTQ